MEASLTISDRLGSIYEEGRIYQLRQKTIDGFSFEREEGKSEKYLRDLFVMQKSPDKKCDGVIGELKVEMKDFDKINSTVRGGAKSREAAGEMLHEISALLRVVMVSLKKVESQENLNFILRDVYKGELNTSNIDKIYRRIEECESSLIDMIDPHSIFFPNPVQSFKNLLRRIDPSRTFVVPDIVMLVVGLEYFIFCSRQNVDNLLEFSRITQGIPKYRLTKKLQNGIMECRADGNNGRTILLP